MPIYEYRCRNCRHVFEKIVLKITAPAIATCPHCGEAAIRKVSAHAKTAIQWSDTNGGE